MFSHKYCLINNKELSTTRHRIVDEVRKMQEASQQGYQDDRASINLCDDTQTLKTVNSLINEKKKLHPRYIIVIGIGGSNLMPLTRQSLTQ